MDLLEAHDMQTLVDTFHKYLKHGQHLKQFTETKRKEQVKQQSLVFVVKCLKEFDITNPMILKVIKWDSSHVWHIFTNNECLPWNECPKLSWTHSQEEAEKIFVVLQWKNTPYQIVPLGSKVNEGFFWHTLNQDKSCACPIQGTTQKVMSKLRQGEYLYHWQKAINILKHDKHLLFGGYKS